MTTENEVSADIRREFERQWHVFSRRTIDLLPENEFREKLLNAIRDNKPLRVKQGFDPTSPDIHIGHAVGIRKLREFQDFGHQIVLIIGDYTAMVGDPSGQSATRPQLGYDEIMKNAETYQAQFFHILDRSKTEVRRNGEWFEKMNFLEIMKLASKFTVARLLERDDFAQRMKNLTPISVHELFYPLMQAYDSVAIRADLELGATEQKFNLLAGRTIQEAYGVPPQCIMTLPILVGLDGEKKMSKSLGNYVGITESNREIFGKIMSIPDDVIAQFFELATDLSTEELVDIKRQLQDPSVNPMGLKKSLGEKIVDMYHPKGSGRSAREEFERVFSQKQLPDDIPELSAGQLSGLGLRPDAVYLVGLITKTGMAKSNSEARQLIQAGGVYLDDVKIGDPAFEFSVKGEMILKVGKRRFLKIKP